MLRAQLVHLLEVQGALCLWRPAATWVKSPCGFLVCFPDAHDVEHLFMCVLAVRTSFL